MISDERIENRLKAIYLLGHLALHLGTVREHDDLLMTAFKVISKKWLELQFAEKQNPVRTITLPPINFLTLPPYAYMKFLFDIDI